MLSVPTNLTPGDGQDLFARFKRAWEGRDPDAMLELFSKDAEYRIDPFMEPMTGLNLSLIHISEPTRPTRASRMPSSA